MTPERGATSDPSNLFRVGRTTFQAERVEPDNGERLVRFRYVIDASAEVFIAREWWEQLGAPETLEVAVRPYPE
jgi:hypothetical protein